MTKYTTAFRHVLVGRKFGYNSHEYAKTSQSQAYNLMTNKYVDFSRTDKVTQEYDEKTAVSVKMW